MRVVGWAFNPDNPSRSIDVHVYIYEEAFGVCIFSGSGGNVSSHGNASRAEAAKMAVVLHDLIR